MGGLEPMQLLQVRQVLGEQVARLEVYLRCLDKEPQVDFHKAWTLCMFQVLLESMLVV